MKGDFNDWTHTRIFDFIFPRNKEQNTFSLKVSRLHEILSFDEPAEFLVSTGLLLFEDVFNISINISLKDSNEFFIDHIELIDSHPAPNPEYVIKRIKIFLYEGFIELTCTEMRYEIIEGPIKSNQMWIDIND